jgi:flagellar biosynthetic protein FliR
LIKAKMAPPLTISAGLPLAFGLVLTRVAGVFFFLPLPVRDATPMLARAGFSLAATLALFPHWPEVDVRTFSTGLFAVWLAGEAAFGLTAGLLVGFLAEFLTLGAQLIGLQAGYGYASVVDPTTQADSEVLQVAARLTGGLLFFAFDLDGQILRALALSLQIHPPGQFVLTRTIVATVLALAANIFSLGLRLAFPVLGLLLLTEISLALVGRLSSSLQLGHSAAPIKMMLTLGTLAALLKIIPGLYLSYAGRLFEPLLSR